MERRDVFVSLVVVARDCLDVLDEVIGSLSLELENKFTNHEILVIDRRSTDGTVARMSELLTELPRIRLIELCSDVGEDMAWAAGLENAIGDLIVFFSMRNDPFDLISSSVDLCLKGSDVVVGVSSDNRPKWYPILGRCFRIVFGRVIGYQVPLFATHFRVLSRRAVNSVLSEKHFHHNVFSRIARLSMSSAVMKYHRVFRGVINERETFSEAFERGISVVTFSSTKPLRMMSLLGLLGSGLSTCISFYSIVMSLLKEKVVEGWTTTIVFLSVQFFLVFLILAFHGEYIARLIEETAEHRDYGVLFEKHSSVMVDEARLNVFEQSESNVMSNVQSGRDR